MDMDSSWPGVGKAPGSPNFTFREHHKMTGEWVCLAAHRGEETVGDPVRTISRGVKGSGYVEHAFRRDEGILGEVDPVGGGARPVT